jgi:hypothetical protein
VTRTKCAYVHIDHKRFEGMGLDYIENFAEPSPYLCRSITTLELGYNPMGPDGAKELAETIKFFGNVETLRLGWCKLGVKGEASVAAERSGQL